MLTDSESKAIVYIRSFSMLAIVACHIFQVYNNRWAFVFNIGVQVFLVLSGLLYGNKQIDSWKDWCLARIRKLYIPMFVFLILVMPLYLHFARYVYSVKAYGMNFLNLQGIPFVFGGSTILGIRHLWFMTAIMFAYFSTPILQYFKKYADILFPVTIVFVAVGYLFLPMKWMFLASWFYLYAIGYLYVNLLHKRIYEYALLVLIVFLLVLIKWRDLTVYFDKLGRLFHDVAGIFIVIWGVKLLSLISNHSVLGLIKLFDKYSFNVFMVHYILIVGPFSLANVTSCVGVNIIIMLFTIVMSTMLFTWINRLLDKLCFDRWFEKLKKV